ncbi:MAG: DEAD/DEAH box helicase, partial [Magnetococcales bacterium]|nr:DEAD/DEAH box helicase [Magnetococcales bacterium]
RELAIQIEQDALTLSGESGLTIAAVYGGVDYEKQRKKLSHGNVDLLIGTPGRLIDYFKQKVYAVNQVEVLIIDEADRMFDMGFIADLRYLMRRLPSFEKRLSMLFSATISTRVQELSWEYMNLPEIISTQDDDVRTAEDVNQLLYHVESRRKISLLVGLFQQLPGLVRVEGETESETEDASGGEERATDASELSVEAESEPSAGEETPESDASDVRTPRIMIFVNTKRMGERLQAWLEHNGVISGYLSGDVPQNKRMRVLKSFQAGSLPVLIATDVAGRGLHIDDVTHVVNYDLPENPEDYVHRIGRTARAGATGDAWTFVDEDGAYHLEAVESYAGHKIPVGWAEEELYADLKRPPAKPRKSSDRSGARRGRGGGRDGSRNERGGGDKRGSATKRRRRSRRPRSGTEGDNQENSAENQQTTAPREKEDGAASEEGAPKSAPKRRRRRRRRRRKGSGQQNGGQGNAASSASNESDA